MKILLCIVLLLVVLTLFAVWPGKRRDALRAPFLGRNCAHRGFFGKDQRPPENSLPAFAAAAKNGYGIELDVQFTADRRLVVFHDDTLDRMTPAKGFVHDMPWAEFSAQPLAGSDEHPPLFADMLRTVAEANPDTPLIVEIKSRSEYKHTYLEELCRATIAELKTYPGPYCIESFDPRILRWFRKHEPGYLRGQLACPPWDYGEAASKPLAFLMGNCLANFMGRPQFIAYKIGYKPLTVKAAEAMGAMRVCWTSTSHHDKKDNEAVIFEHYRPELYL